MITGVLLAIARVSGETAPLLFTALNNQFYSTDLNAPMASLPVDHLPIRDEPLQGLAGFGLDGRAAHHPCRAWPVDPGANPQLSRTQPMTAVATTTVPATNEFPTKISVRQLRFYYGKIMAVKDVNSRSTPTR